MFRLLGILVLLLSISFVFSIDCSTYTSESTCTGSSFGTYSSCAWRTGVTCSGSSFGFCTPLTCTSVLTCARSNSSLTSVATTFQTNCLPPGYTAVPLSECSCNSSSTCTSPCSPCQECKNGACVNFNVCSSSTPCPVGYSCTTDSNGCSTCTANTCPGNTSPYTCATNPCSAPPPYGCPSTAICIPNYCGGCNRNYFDSTGVEICNNCSASSCGIQPEIATIVCPDGSSAGLTGNCISTPTGCAWEIRECPCNLTSCPSISDCTYGIATSSNNGCPYCSCKPPPTCTGTCPSITCPVGTVPSAVLGECCLNCTEICDQVVCPSISCPSPYVMVTLSGTCCPVCVPPPQCPNPCPAVTTCATNEMIITDNCGCSICHPKIDCSTANCTGFPVATPTNPLPCGSGFKLIVEDGQCCPTCVPIPTCSTATCPTVTCSNPITPDLSCCPVCPVSDPCAGVVCPIPPCYSIGRITRKGQCCSQCPQCEPTSTQNCDRDDNLVCRSGYFTGPNCNVPVTATSSFNITATFCIKLSTGEQCPVLKAQDMSNYLLSLSNVSASLLTVTSFSQIPSTCCWNVAVEIAASTSSGTNPKTEGSKVVSSMNSQNGFSNVSTSSSSNTTSSSNTSNSSFLLPSILSVLFSILIVIYA